MKKEKCAKVEWFDSTSYEGWHKVEADDHEASQCVTVGIIEEENKKVICITQSISKTTGNVDSTITIPKSCVNKIKRFNV